MTRVPLTPLLDWREALRRRPPRPLDIAGLGRVVVVAAHPDDETLAVSGVMQAVHRAGHPVELVVATDGEAAFADLGPAGRAALGRARRQELHRALHEQGLGAVGVHWLGLPDSALDADATATALTPLLCDADSYLAPWPHDPHPDHAAAGRAAAMAATATTHGWSYPIWMWAWQRPEHPEIPWSRAFSHPLDRLTRDRKRDAISCFESQLRGGPDDEPAILPAAVLEYFDSDVEVLFRSPPATSAPRQRFDQLYHAHRGDPWQDGSWYEQRKRAVLLACLPRPRYRHAAEPGCGTGRLTRELAARCARVDASDFAGPAVLAARDATADLPGVTVRPHTLPDGLPTGVDLAVLSEVLYYLSPTDLAATVQRLGTALEPGGDLVVVHWRGWPAEAPHEATDVHRLLRADTRFAPLVEHVDSEFLLQVLRRR